MHGRQLLHPDQHRQPGGGRKADVHHVERQEAAHFPSSPQSFRRRPVASVEVWHSPS